MQEQPIVEFEERLNRAVYWKFIRFVISRCPWGLLMLGFFRPIFPRNDWTMPFETTVQIYQDEFSSYTVRRGHTIHRTMSYNLIAKVVERPNAFYVKYKCRRYDFFAKEFMNNDQIAVLRTLLIHRFGNNFREMK